MHDLVSLNGEITNGAWVKTNALSMASLYGKGVFTTVAIHGGDPFVWEKHARRLTNDSERVGIDLSGFSAGIIRSALNELIERNGILDGRARITLLDESPSQLWPTGSPLRTSLLITTADFITPTVNFRLGLSEHPVNSSSLLVGVKSSNYLDRVMARAKARNAGTDESIQINERGETASAIMANVFWVSRGKLFTPSISTGCLAGTTREFILENLVCEQVEASVSELETAEDIFLTSAGIGVVQVAEFNGRTLSGKSHPIRKILPPR